MEIEVQISMKSTHTCFPLNVDEIYVFQISEVLQKFAHSHWLCTIMFTNCSISFSAMGNYKKGRDFKQATPYGFQGNHRFNSPQETTNQASLNRNPWNEVFHGNQGTSSTSQAGSSHSTVDSRDVGKTSKSLAVEKGEFNPFNMNEKPSGESENQKRLRILSSVPYLDRRGLKGLLVANPRFHLIELNGVPKFIKASEFLHDLMTSMPNVKVKHVVSVHIHEANADVVNYKIGFNNTRIIAGLKEILGTGTFQLYKKSVQAVFPNLAENKMCEFNKVVGDNFFQPVNKSPYMLTHKEASLLAVVEMLEKVCGEKVWGINSVCCNGFKSFITLSDPNLLFCLNRCASECNFSIVPSDTATFTGTIPSELIPFEDTNIKAPTNSSDTAKLSTEDLIKFDGFKILVDKHTADAKASHLTVIKRSMLEFQSTMNARMNEFESITNQEFMGLKNSIDIQRAQVELNSNQLKSIVEKSDIINENIIKTFELLNRYVYKRDEKKLERLSKRMTTPEQTSQHSSSFNDEAIGEAVNPSTNGKTDLFDEEFDDELA